MRWWKEDLEARIHETKVWKGPVANPVRLYADARSTPPRIAACGPTGHVEWRELKALAAHGLPGVAVCDLGLSNNSPAVLAAFQQ